jgi:N-acetyl-gamma-glutamyl-phosphate reductase
LLPGNPFNHGGQTVRPGVAVNSFERQGNKNDKEYHLYPNVARLAGSNFCHIGLDYDCERSRVKIVSATDDLGKGAAGSAVQNMNVMFQFCEKTGLRAFGL